MKLSAADAKTYPKLAQYVRCAIPLLTGNRVIMHNLKKNGSFTTAQANHALTWGNEPLIVITDLSHGQCGVPSAYGCTRGSNLHQIEIDTGLANDFENAPHGQKVGKNAKGNNVFVVGVTLLHELCHLGRLKAGIPETTEAGFDFEQGAYGKAVP